jgi:hypothetical protein
MHHSKKQSRTRKYNLITNKETSKTPTRYIDHIAVIPLFAEVIHTNFHLDKYQYRMSYSKGVITLSPYTQVWSITFAIIRIYQYIY